VKGKGSVNGGTAIGDDHIVTASAESNLDWFGTVRGRFGYSWDRTLFYFTGGFAFGGVKDKVFANFEEAGNSDPTTVKKDDTLTGIVLGGGVEHAFSPSWSLKAEYQLMDLGATTTSATASIDDGDDTTVAKFRNEHMYHTVRVGLNYHIHQGYEPLK
jgi:outer membrane immunogenic protein